MITPSLPQFKAWARANHRLAIAVCTAQAFAETVRARVDAYVLPIFARYQFTVREEWRDSPRRSQEITKPGDLYLSDQEELVEQFYEECKVAHIAHGWKGDRDHCPALSAEYALIQAQNALLESGQKLTGIEPCDLWGENRAKMLDLLLGACLSKQDERKAA